MGQFRTVDVMRENNHKLVLVLIIATTMVLAVEGRYSGDILYNDSLVILFYGLYQIWFWFSVQIQRFSALGEFVSTNANVPDGIYERVRNDGSTSTEFIVNGEPVDVKDYVKNRLMLGRDIIFKWDIYLKTWSIDARFTHLIADLFWIMVYTITDQTIIQ